LQRNTEQFASLALLGAAILLAFLTYQPGLSGVFLMDDATTLKTLNSYGGVTDTTTLLHFLRDHLAGPTGRPISMLTLLLDDQYWPGDPASYRHTNLLIHLVCGLLIALLSYKVALAAKADSNTAAWIGALTAMLWLLHPFNTSTTLYIVQRMTQLSTLFVLLALTLYTYGRLQLANKPGWAYTLMTTALVPVGLMAVLSKENGALLPLFILSLEATIYRNISKQRLLYPWIGFFIALPIAIMAGYAIYAWGSLTAGFHLRDFSLSERLLTEPRVLIDYLGNIFIPRASGTGLFHDDFTVSRTMTSPADTLPAIVALLGLLLSAVWLRKKQPVYSFAVFWFVGGHLMESSFLNLEIYFEHRNYLPMVGPLFAVAYYLAATVNKFTSAGSGAIQRVIIFILIMAPMSYLCASNAKTWSSPSIMFPRWAQEHPRSLNARIHLVAYLQSNGNPQAALSILEEIYTENPQRIDIALYALSIACTHTIDTSIQSGMILKDIDKAEYNGGFSSSLDDLISSLADNATPCNSIDRKSLHDILFGLQNNPTFQGRSFELAQLLVKHAQLFIAEGNLNQSMSLLDEARKRRRGVAIPLYQAMLLNSAGLHKAALEYIDLAIAQDANRPYLSPSRTEELEQIGTSIRTNSAEYEH
jgi:tetratricopeptide (TPR) repeat protein